MQTPCINGLGQTPELGVQLAVHYNGPMIFQLMSFGKGREVGNGREKKKHNLTTGDRKTQSLKEQSQLSFEIWSSS